MKKKCRAKKPCSFSLSPHIADWIKETAWRKKTSSSALVESLVVESMEAEKEDRNHGSKTDVR